MEHQDTKLTSMRPRLKELNDNPYLYLSVVIYTYLTSSNINAIVYHAITNTRKR